MRPLTDDARDDPKARARVLRAQGMLQREIAAELGVSKTTIRRWLVPGVAERNRVSSNRAKQRRRGVCEVCGGITRYNGHNVNGPSRICIVCIRIEQMAARKWTREKIIAAIKLWASEHGRPPTSPDWLRGGEYWPPFSSVYRSKLNPHAPFAAWSDAIEAAGFPRPETGGRYIERPQKWKYDHAEAMRLRAEGHTYAEIARRVGVSRSSIEKLVQGGGTTAQVRS